MRDRSLVAKRLAQIETYVRELQTLARPEEIRRDVREERFVSLTLQFAIQSVLAIASHVVSDERLGEPRTNRHLIDLLERHGWTPSPLALRLGNMVDLRNGLVHNYDDVDLAIVEDAVKNHLDDLLEFVRAVRSRLQEGKLLSHGAAAARPGGNGHRRRTPQGLRRRLPKRKGCLQLRWP